MCCGAALPFQLGAIPLVGQKRMVRHRLPRKWHAVGPHYDPDGFQIGRSEMILGLLYKTKRKPTLAVQHLTEAKRILSQFGQTPILARVQTALAELGQ
jgi:hypothetical protein